MKTSAPSTVTSMYVLVLPAVPESATDYRVTVLRDGEVRGSGPVTGFTDAEILQLIVGRSSAISRTSDSRWVMYRVPARLGP